MSVSIRYSAIVLQAKVFSRNIRTSSALNMVQWRVERGLPINRNAEGMLVDGPDYTYLDGRPTPLLRKQKKRMHFQRTLAEKMVTLCSDVDFAKKRYQQLEEAKEKERQQIIDNRLKPKGSSLLQNK